MTTTTHTTNTTLTTTTKTPKQQTIQSFIDHCEQIEYDVVATLDFKRGITRAEAIAAVRRLWNKIDIAAFGRHQVQHKGQRLAKVYVIDIGHNHSKAKADKAKQASSKEPVDTSTVDIKHIKHGRASFHHSNWHFHCAIKLGGKFESAQQLVEAITRTWRENTANTGSHGKIELMDKSRQRGWYAYLAAKIKVYDNDGLDDKDWWADKFDAPQALSHTATGSMNEQQQPLAGRVVEQQPPVHVPWQHATGLGGL